MHPLAKPIPDSRPNQVYRQSWWCLLPNWRIFASNKPVYEKQLCFGWTSLTVRGFAKYGAGQSWPHLTNDQLKLNLRVWRHESPLIRWKRLKNFGRKLEYLWSLLDYWRQVEDIGAIRFQTLTSINLPLQREVYLYVWWQVFASRQGKSWGTWTLWLRWASRGLRDRQEDLEDYQLHQWAKKALSFVCRLCLDCWFAESHIWWIDSNWKCCWVSKQLTGRWGRKTQTIWPDVARVAWVRRPRPWNHAY